MASSFVIKCKTKSGHHSLMGLEPSSSVKDLKNAIKDATGILPENMKVLIGYPPKRLKLDHDNQKLSEIGFEKGVNFIIHVENVLSNEANVEVSSTSKNGVEKHEAENKPDLAAIKPSQSRNLNDEEAALSQSLGIMMRITVPSNNSCLFTSIYFITNKGKLDLDEGNKLRKVIVEFIEKNRREYNEAVLGKPCREYKNWIINPMNWGGAIELAIFSKYFKLEICAIDVVSCQMHRFGENLNYTSRCFLVYDGIHYDPLVMQYENRVETIFKSEDLNLLDLAMEIAREAHSSHQFTDTTNFKLQCQDCGLRIIGEKEATAHATATGHANYGELK